MTLARWLLPLLLACLFTPTLALADARSGPYIVGGLIHDAGSATALSSDTNEGARVEVNGKLDRSKTGGTLAAGYQFTLSPPFILMLEAGKDFGTALDLSAGTGHGDSLPDTLNVRWQWQRDWYVALKPGWQVSPSTTIYLSLAYHRGSVRLDRQTTRYCMNGACDIDRTEVHDDRLEGTGIGLGLVSALSSRWFLRFEVERIDFGRVEFVRNSTSDFFRNTALDRLDPTNTVGRVMIGWRF